MIKAVYGEVFDDERKDWIKRIQSFAEVAAEKTLPRTIHQKSPSSGFVENLHQSIHPKCQSLSFVVSLLPQDQIGSYLHQRSLQSSHSYRQGCQNHYSLQRNLPQRNQPYQGVKVLVTCLEYPSQHPSVNQEQWQIDLHQPTASSESGSTYPEVKSHDYHDSLTPTPYQEQPAPTPTTNPSSKYFKLYSLYSFKQDTLYFVYSLYLQNTIYTTEFKKHTKKEEYKYYFMSTCFDTHCSEGCCNYDVHDSTSTSILSNQNIGRPEIVPGRQVSSFFFLSP